MKKYNIQNYIRWKDEVETAVLNLPKIKDGDYTIYDRKQMITCFLPLVGNLSRKFSTSQQASGVMTIMDLIQEGCAGLTQAVDRLDYETLKDSEDQEKTLKSFLSPDLLTNAIVSSNFLNCSGTLETLSFIIKVSSYLPKPSSGFNVISIVSPVFLPNNPCSILGSNFFP